MRKLLPTILLILAPVFVWQPAGAQPVIAESGTVTEPEQHGNTKTWIALGAMVAVLAAGALVSRRVSRKTPQGEETVQP